MAVVVVGQVDIVAMRVLDGGSGQEVRWILDGDEVNIGYWILDGDEGGIGWR
jgi:hypothetical protein